MARGETVLGIEAADPSQGSSLKGDRTGWPSAHGPRLLILDDDEAICATVSAIGRSAAHEVSASTAAETFFEQLRAWKPSHVIVDLRMPDVDGIGILKRMATQRTDASVIIMSGLGARILESAARAAHESGLNVIGILPKPFTPKQLRELLAVGAPAAEARHRRAGSGDAGHAAALEVSPGALGAALEADQIQPFFQPKISCATRALVGFEALARWPRPDGGMIMPDLFIPLAEQSGLMGALTRRIFQHAFKWFAKGFRHSDITMAINLSATLLSDPGLPAWMSQCCAKAAIHPQQVILEITETATTGNQLEMMEILTQARIHGFRLSIDDFGVGYSSLVQLARMPFSEIKIDRMFVSSAATSEESRKIITSTIGLAQALDLHVTAEGVEDAWTLDFLRDRGCDSAQGFLIGRPLDGAAAMAWHESYKAVPGGHGG
jgi:EAL domain-containing protein (putative c-di-GMP-specific phosphodiesterase class I)/ActR/RegA family two-component response regulator